jgi:hypothetical protein
VLGYHRQLEEIMRLLSPRSSRPAIALSLLATLVACGGGAAPVLDSIDDQIVAVGADLTLTLRATDPDGDALSYSFRSDVPDLGERASIATTPAGTGLFRWRPLAADVGTWHFDFVASDGDHDTTVTVTIQVKSAVGDQTTPVFRQPLGSGTTLDLAVRQCLDLDVVVEDQDSPEVALTEEDPLIEGATLEVTSGLAAVWHWCPSREQIDAEDRYTLTLGADDGDNPKVPKNYLIVLRRPGQTNCPGTAPVVTHTPADESTVVDLTLDATITDDLGLKQPPLLYYSTTAPASPPDLATMAQTTMVLISGTMQNGVWAADVPNPVATRPAGTAANLYYVIVANDDDDDTGTCDHETQAPATGTYQMRVTNPGGAGGLGLCESCSADVQCGDADDHCVRVGQTDSCLQGCTGVAGECPTGYTCSANPVSSVNGASGRQCVPTTGTCAMAPPCEDDIFEDNDTRAQAAANLPDLDPATYDFTSCPLADGSNDDEDWFPIILTADATVTLTLAGMAVSDLDLVLYDGTGTRLQSATGSTSNETISRCLTAGTYYVRVYAWGAGAPNDYTLTYARSVGACPAVCTDDRFEPDDNRDQARQITYGGFTQAGQICANDDDYFKLALFNGETVTIDLTFTHSATGDLDLHFYDSAGVDLTPCSEAMPATCTAAQGQGASSNERYSFTAPAACASLCTYYVAVHGWRSSQNSYSISILAPP